MYRVLMYSIALGRYEGIVSIGNLKCSSHNLLENSRMVSLAILSKQFRKMTFHIAFLKSSSIEFI